MRRIRPQCFPRSSRRYPWPSSQGTVLIECVTLIHGFCISLLARPATSGSERSGRMIGRVREFENCRYWVLSRRM
jgi:hypothetical protein